VELPPLPLLLVLLEQGAPSSLPSSSTSSRLSCADSGQRAR
jgi:hypothetical protein